MACVKDCKSERWTRKHGPVDDPFAIEDCGLCGRTFYMDTMEPDGFTESWVCECCTREASPWRVFTTTVKLLLRGGR